MNKNWLLSEIVSIMSSSSCPASIGLGEKFTMLRRGVVFANGDHERRVVPEQRIIDECPTAALKFAFRWLLERRIAGIKRQIAVSNSELAATVSKLRLLDREDSESGVEEEK